MKKLMVMMAMAAGLTCFAGSQNDTVISFSTRGPDTYDGRTVVVDNECYALVWIKDGFAFGGFNDNGALADEENNAVVRIVNVAVDGHCPDVSFVVAAEDVAEGGKYFGGSFKVYLLDTRDESTGVPAVPSNNAVTRVARYGECVGASVVASAVAASVGDKFKTIGPDTYADGTAVLNGERYVLVAYPEENGRFKGITWDFKPVGEADRIIGIFSTATDAHCAEKAVQIESPIDGYGYEIVIIDSRIDGAISTSEDGVSPKFVSGWGEFACDENGVPVSIRWEAVKIGLSGSYPVSEMDFDFDPTPYVETGYAAVSPAEGKWRVYRLPQAWVETIESPALSKKDGSYWHLRAETEVPDSFALESAYKFSAFDTALEPVAMKFLQNNMDFGALDADEQQIVNAWYKQVSPFWGWNADFEVSFDHEVEADSVILAGFYRYTSAWADKYTFDWVKGDNEPWVGSSPEKTFKPGESLRLLKSYIGKSGSVTMNYGEICQKVVQFLCGVKNLSEKNYGTTMSVRLCIYENTGRCHESGSKVVIGTYRYTFKGPLNVEFNETEGADKPVGTVVNPADIHITCEGTSTLPLSAPTYEKADNPNIAFVGWSNKVANALWTAIPAGTWADADHAIQLYAVWQKAQIVVVSNETAQIKDQNIKVTDDWVKDVLKIEPTLTETVQEKLNEPVGDGTKTGELKKWEAYVLGLDATDPDAAVKVEKTSGAEEDKAIVVSTVQAPPPDSGFKVTYSLDKIDKTTEEPIDEAHKGEPQESKDLKIDLEPKDDTPTGYYKMNVIVTPDGAEKGEKYPAENTIGVLKVESEEKLLPVAVPWVSLTDGQSIMPDEIVDPRTLSEGDILHVYQKEGEVYSNWYVKDGKWQTMPTLKVAANDQQTLYAAEAMKEGSVARGVGVWLERKDTSKPIYITGQYKADAAPVQIEKPAEGEKPKYNLIAPTGIEQEETDLNGVASLTSDNVSDKDQLMMVRNGVPTYFRFDTTSKKWYYNRQVYVVKDGKTVGVKTKKVFDDAKVPVGIGLWYISGGGNPSIDWKSEEAK